MDESDAKAAEGRMISGMEHTFDTKRCRSTCDRCQGMFDLAELA